MTGGSRMVKSIMIVDHENLWDMFEILHINIVRWQILLLSRNYTHDIKYSLKNSVSVIFFCDTKYKKYH